MFADPAYLFSNNAIKLLGERLRRDGFFEHPGEFDFINRDWTHWKQDYFQRVSVKYAPEKLDGLNIAVGQCNLYALAKGTIFPESSLYRLTVSEVSIVLYDSFDFENWQPLGMWNCDLKRLIARFAYNIENKDFRTLRQNTGFGNDFYVPALPIPLEHEGILSYVTFI